MVKISSYKLRGVLNGGEEIVAVQGADTIKFTPESLNQYFISRNPELENVITADSVDTLTNKTFDVNGTGNVLSNVGISNLADGTPGELISWDDTNSPVAIDAGTANYVLTSNGPGLAPTFQEISSGGWDVDDQVNGNYGHGLNALDSITVGSGLYNIAIGTDAGKFVTSGDDNIVLGHQALDFSNASQSIAIGTRALSGSSGSGNVAIGDEVANDLSSGYHSVFIGSSAGDGMTSSHNSIMIGYQATGDSAGAPYQISIGNKNYYAITGMMSASVSDTDVTKGMVINGPSAFAPATTNTSAGNLDLKMGDHATAGGSAGLVRILAPDDTVIFAVDEDGDFSGTTMLADITNGNYAFGSGAGDSIAVGSGLDNITIGENAGTAIITGDRNVALGTDAGSSINSSSGNTYIGHETGKLWTGGGNVLIGDSAGSDGANSQSSNVFIGQSAGEDTTSTNSAIAIGNSAGRLVADFDGAVLVGHYAGRNSIGEYSIAIGYQAGYASAGSNNILIGRIAGTTNATTYTDSIILGYQSTGVSTSDPHQLIIGDAITGHMSALTDVDYSAKNLTISGPSAYASATTNQDGGDLILRGGQKASGGGTSGDTRITAPVLQDKTDPTKQVDFDLSAITTATQRTWTVPDEDIDFGNLGGWNVNDTTNGNYGHGLNALDSLTSGTNNTAIGTNAGTSQTILSQSVFIGQNAGQNASTNRSILLGAYSGANLTGSNNIALGYNTLGDVSASGPANIVLGSFGGTSLTGGASNVLIGDNVASAITTASTSIAIGAHANLLSNTARGQITIGYGNNVLFTKGYMSADTDQDVTDGITIYGPSAYASATTNTSAGNLDLKMGDHATAGGSAGLVRILAPNDAVRFAVDEDGDFSGSLFRSDYANENYIFGYLAGDEIVSGGTKNITIGEQAGTKISTGGSIIAIGSEAAKQIASGINVVAIGSEAYLNGTASNQIAIGYKALGLAGTNGGGNVAVGNYALESGAGAGNTGLGHNSLSDVFTGTYNVGIGYNSGNLLETGDYNVFIGPVDALSATDDDQFVVGNGTHNAIEGYFGARSDVDYSGRSLTIHGVSAFAGAVTNTNAGNLDLKMGEHATAGGNAGLVRILAPDDSVVLSFDEDGNTAGKVSMGWDINDNVNYNYGQGVDALNSLTSGTNNIAIGRIAAQTVTASSNVVALGYQALGAVSSSVSGSIAIGSQAGRGAGEYSVAIGYSALNATTGDPSHSVAIGNLAGDQMRGDYNIWLGDKANASSTLFNHYLAIGSGGPINIYGHMTPISDYDITSGLVVEGPSAYASAVTNTSAGNLDLKMGDHATAGGSAGKVQVLAPDDSIAMSWDEDGNLDGKTIRADITNGNYAFGSGAGDSITVGSGRSNITIGQNAGTAITSGDYNIMIGEDAGLLSNTTQAIVIGRNAMSDGSGSGQSIAIGDNALEDSASGINGRNIAIGGGSLKILNSGSNNLAIGYGAGNNGTTLDFSVAIGSLVQYPSATNDDQLVIGNGTHNAIEGSFGARSDVDYSGRSLTIYGPSAYTSAVTNTSAGNLDLKMGDHAIAGGSAGLVRILAPDDTVIFAVDEDGDFSGTTMLADVTNHNYAYGASALDSVTVGSAQRNVAMGSSAGTAISTGDDNTVIGNQAGLGLTTGSGNTFLGASAGRGGGLGTEGNTAVGYLALYGGVNPASNVAVGQESLRNANNGDNNAALGYQSLYSLANSSNNVAIGYKAGYAAVSTNYSLFMGNEVVPLSTTNDDQFVVGNGTHNAVEGYFGARSDVDYSGRNLQITGPSAFASATTNQDGGDLILRGGQKASGGGISGNTVVEKLVAKGAVFNHQTGTTYTIVDSDNGKILTFDNAAAIAVTLPDTLDADFQCTIIQIGAGVPTVTRSGTDTINGAATGVTPSAQWKAMYLSQYGAGTWLAVL